MRQIMSTALVALIIGALAGATMGAVAQSEPASEPAPATDRAFDTAGLNADKVDGRHAVKYTNARNARRGKLVATNRKGELPSNIVRPFWGLVRNMPAGFADGVDNEGVTGVRVVTVTALTSLELNNGGAGQQLVDCPAGFLAVGGGFDWVSGVGFLVRESAAWDADTWRIYVQSANPGDVSIKAQVTCMRAEPDGLTIAAGRSVFSSGN